MSESSRHFTVCGELSYDAEWKRWRVGAMTLSTGRHVEVMTSPGVRTEFTVEPEFSERGFPGRCLFYPVTGGAPVRPLAMLGHTAWREE